MIIIILFLILSINQCETNRFQYFIERRTTNDYRNITLIIVDKRVKNDEK